MNSEFEDYQYVDHMNLKPKYFKREYTNYYNLPGVNDILDKLDIKQEDTLQE